MTSRQAAGVTSATPPSAVEMRSLRFAISFMKEVPQASNPTIGTLIAASAPVASARPSCSS